MRAVVSSGRTEFAVGKSMNDREFSRVIRDSADRWILRDTSFPNDVLISDCDIAWRSCLASRATLPQLRISTAGRIRLSEGISFMPCKSPGLIERRGRLFRWESARYALSELVTRNFTGRRAFPGPRKKPVILFIYRPIYVPELCPPIS